MDNQERMREEYTVGEEIRWQLTVTHSQGMELRKVKAVFGHQAGGSAPTEGRELGRSELTSSLLQRAEVKLQPTSVPSETTSRGVLRGRV
jgi:hypothetical protein